MNDKVIKEIIIIAIITLSIIGWCGVAKKNIIKDKEDYIAFNINYGGE